MADAEFPLVSIVCTAYNHEDFIELVLDSVLAQNYPKLELILVDNGSTDQTKNIIENWFLKNRHKIPIFKIFRAESWGYCASFNNAFLQSSGKYFIDLSGDDVLEINHIKYSVAKLEAHPEAVVCFSDAYLKKSGDKLKTFYPRDKNGMLKIPVKQGDIYEELVSSHILLSVTMVVRSDTFKFIGMYDEGLNYEDFDIMVRMSRNHPFVFSDHIGIVKNIHSKSLSAGQYRAKNSIMLPSTLKVCQKIKAMNRSKEEDDALKVRVLYELKHALFSANFEVASGFIDLAKNLGASGFNFFLFRLWEKHQWDLSSVYSMIKRT
ncbi:glycosyltransferase family 2 protein [Shivajiella indica]|uniref:Glycosyltransferase family 2 protein n=1 Tax=Shivajiella indica TaxID=872115 RepID=A0ABW5BC50_9BACT